MLASVGGEHAAEESLVHREVRGDLVQPELCRHGSKEARRQVASDERRTLEEHEAVAHGVRQLLDPPVGEILRRTRPFERRVLRVTGGGGGPAEVVPAERDDMVREPVSSSRARNGVPVESVASATSSA